MHLTVDNCGIPHLAKNQRDMGHPSSVRERGRRDRTRGGGKMFKAKSR
jgi:hypothetical protein